MKKGVCFSGFLLLILIALPLTSAIYVGVTDGYINDVNGNIISGASVSVSVSGCSGTGCSGTATSESTGYYVVNNLNLPKFGLVGVTATESTGSGSATTQADEYYIAHTNVSICYPPSSPTLTPVLNNHNTTRIFQWIGSTSPLYDEFNLDSTYTNYISTSSTTRIDLSAGPHTWRVRTCNANCCSSWSSSSFTVTNSVPTIPTNANSDKINEKLSLSWTSGNDSDGDTIYDELEYENTTTILISPAISPINVSYSLLLTWRVRTCDSFGACSNWLSTNSITCLNTTQSCPVCGGTGGGGGGGGGGGSNEKKCENQTINNESIINTQLSCNGIVFANIPLLDIKIKIGNKNKFSLHAKGVNWEDLEYCPWCYDGIKNYDETATDCGGSCVSCSEAPIPAVLRQETMSKPLFTAVLFLALTAIILISSKLIIFLRHRFFKTKI